MNLKFFNFKNLDKKTKMYIGIGVGSILLLFIILIVLKIMIGNRINSRVFETRLKNSAIAYYKKYPDKLPKENGGKVSITIDELVNAGNLKSLNKLLDKGLTCSGNVNVSNNNGYYLYQPVIECSDDYKTSLLYKTILDDNSIVESGNGLYKMNDFYIFRGENLNNYVKFAGHNWLIVRINNDNTIRLVLNENIDSIVWDDRYNNEKEEFSGKNDYAISRIETLLNNYFNNKNNDYKFSEENKSLIVPKNLCIGSRNENSTSMDDSIECSKTTSNVEPIGLLQANEFVLASIEPTCKNLLDIQCTNYNYLASVSNAWTLTANTKNTYEVYKISRRIISSRTDNYGQPRFVINISADALYSSGNGTQTNPYIIK